MHYTTFCCCFIKIDRLFLMPIQHTWKRFTNINIEESFDDQIKSLVRRTPLLEKYAKNIEYNVEEDYREHNVVTHAGWIVFFLSVDITNFGLEQLLGLPVFQNQNILLFIVSAYLFLAFLQLFIFEEFCVLRCNLNDKTCKYISCF